METQSISAALLWRYATKKFDTSKKISPADLDVILESIRMAPSSFGLQPFHVDIIETPSIREKLQKAGFNQTQFTTCSHLLVFSSDTDFSFHLQQLIAHLVTHNTPSQSVSRIKKTIQTMVLLKTLLLQRHSWASRQAYIALGFALLTAAQLKIDACPMEGFSSSQFDSILKLPPHRKSIVVLTLGYRDTSDVLHAKYRKSRDELFSVL